MLSKTYHRGVTLIELMVGIVIVGMLLAFAAPSYTAWLHNSQIRTAAESILNGIQLTRAEAVRRNTSVQFSLTALPASSWTVSVPSTAEVVQTRSGAEGSATASVATTPAGPPAATTVTFSGLGRVAANSGASATLTMANISSTVTSTATRALSIRVSGGVVRMCDSVLPASDPQSCSF